MIVLKQNTCDDVARALDALDALEPPLDREGWVKLLMAAHDAGISEDDARSWSERGPNFEERAFRSAWRSIKPGAVTARTLYKAAIDAGWRAPAERKSLTAEQIAQYETDRARRRKEADKQSAEAQAKAAQRAQRLWDAAAPADTHPYLERKGVQSHGLRVGNWEYTDASTGEVYQIPGCLLIPMRDRTRKLWSLQCIEPDAKREKRYLKGGAKRGNFFPIGAKPIEHEGRKVFVLGEGYATCASVHECTGHMVLVCFDASNLLAVAQQVRERDPNAIILFAADNDLWNRKPDGTPHNPGVEAATKAAAAVGGLVAIPPFTPEDAFGKDEKGNLTGPKDFNDWHGINGPQSVAQVIAQALARPVTVVLAPDRQSATGAAIAMRALKRGDALSGNAATFARGGLGDLVVHVYAEDLAERAAELCARYPNGHVYILARPGDEQAAFDAAEAHGVCAETLAELGGGRFDNWFDAMMDELDALADANPSARQMVEQVLEGAVAAQEVQAGALEQPQSVTPTRDEERRHQQQEENRRLQEVDTGAMIPSDLSVDAMIERCVWVADGRHVAYVTDDRSMFLKFDDFRALTVSSKTEVEVQQREKLVSKWYPNANLWQSDKRRVDAMTATFHPGSPIITANPNGLCAVNTWRPIKRWPATADITPFLEQVEYLFPDPTERNAFLDWLAHIEQKPGELPHYGWLHIAENTGTGRNWMASVLARVFRGYVAPNVDLPGLLDSPYNGELGGRVLAIVDEVQEGASEGNYRHAERLKSMVNAEMRTVNNKYGMKYVEFNTLRWLVFSNHKNALPLNDEDRRFRVVMHKAPPRSPEMYERLYALLQDAEFINSVGVYLRERDISRFKPGERPPLNADKRAAIAASKPMSTQAAEEIVACWPADVITYKHAIELLTGDPEKKDFPAGMRRAMEEAGAVTWGQGDVKRIKMNGAPHRVWVLRKRDKWMAESTDAIRREVGRANVNDQIRPATAVLADAVEMVANLHEPPI